MPAGSTVADAGEYENVPATGLVALSCRTPNAAPSRIGAGESQVIDGIPRNTVMVRSISAVV